MEANAARGVEGAGTAVRRVPLDGYYPTSTVMGGCADATSCIEIKHGSSL